LENCAFDYDSIEENVDIRQLSQCFILVGEFYDKILRNRQNVPIYDESQPKSAKRTGITAVCLVDFEWLGKKATEFQGSQVRETRFMELSKQV
jgi:hypothetical protein